MIDPRETHPPLSGAALTTRPRGGRCRDSSRRGRRLAPAAARLAAWLAALAGSLSGSTAGAAVELSVVSVDPSRPHLVAPGTATTFVLSLHNDSPGASAGTVTVGPPDAFGWQAQLCAADELFQPVGELTTALDFDLAAGQSLEVLARLEADAALPDGATGEARVSLSATGTAPVSVVVRGQVKDRPKVYFVAMDSVGPGYLELDRFGNHLQGEAPPLMPRSRQFLAGAAFFPNAEAHLPSSTDPNHLAALSGSWPGTLGILSVNRNYAGLDADGGAVALLPSRDLLRFGADGEPIETIYDLLANPAAGGTPRALSAMVTGKNWVGDFFADGTDTVAVIVGGNRHPFYVPAAESHRIGDPPSDPDAESDREGTNIRGPRLFKKRFNVTAEFFGSQPQTLPSDRWIAEAALRIVSAEDPDAIYVVLAEPDSAQHLFGAADRPGDWSDEGTPELWDDTSIFNPHANRSPVLDVIYEADFLFGLMLDQLAARGTLDRSIVILLSDHSQTTVMRDYLNVGEILSQGGVTDDAIERLICSGELGTLSLTDPAQADQIEALLEGHQELHPVLGRSVHPFIVLDRGEMDSGVDGVEGAILEDGIAGNKEGAIFSEWNADYPVDDNSKVRWPDLIVFNRHNYLNLFTRTSELGAGAASRSIFNAHHGSAQAASILLALRGPGILPGVFAEVAKPADVAPTIYPLLGLALPPNVNGQALLQILGP